MPKSARRLPLNAFSSDFLMQAGLLAVDRWDRLTPEEQSRFRDLVRAAGGNPKSNLSKAEHRELRTIWKKLEARRLVGDVARILRSPRSSVNGS
jgi:hypothetical protein